MCFDYIGFKLGVALVISYNIIYIYIYSEITMEIVISNLRRLIKGLLVKMVRKQFHLDRKVHPIT